MALKSDAQGFLVGAPAGDLSGEMRELRRGVKSLRDTIREDGGKRAAKPALRADARRALADQPVATPVRRPRADQTMDGHEVVARSGVIANAGSRAAGRLSSATAEAAKAIVNEEADASVKAFNEIAQPLKRGWEALRGKDDSGEQQAGWLKRIFNALTGRGGEGRQREDGALREAIAAVRGGGGATTADSARRATASGRGAPDLPRDPSGRWARQAAAPELRVAAIERHLRSIDSKVRKPKREGLLLPLLLATIKAIPAVIEWFRDNRMDTNLGKIQRTTAAQLAVSKPFFAYARKRLREMGEEEPEQKGGPGMFAALIAGSLGALVAKLASLTAKIPLLGRALASLARLLGAGAAAGAIGRGVPVPVGAKTPRRWGRSAEGIRGNRAARVARVMARSAGRVLMRVPVLGGLIGVGAGVLGSGMVERDDTLTRGQKNAAHGRNWGGVGGMLGGAAGGAALGGAIAGPIGLVVGGVLGSVLGQYLGGSLGQMLGERVTAIMAPAAAAFGEVKLWGVASWQYLRESYAQLFERIGTAFSAIGDRIATKWDDAIGVITGVFDSVVSMIQTVLTGLRNVPVIGGAIRAAEEAARAAAAAARQMVSAAVDTATDAAGAAKEAAGRAWEGFIDRAIPKGVRDKIAYGRALETAASYKAGNIGGLDDAHTRELVASTAMTESSGGKLDTTNSLGYVGRYQAGAEWLAEAGLIKGGPAAVTAAMRADGFTRQQDWGKAGGMTRFLSNDANWNNGLSLAKYKASAEVQDAAFKTVSDAAYRQLVKGGEITPESSQEHIAGLLKGRHIAGLSGVRKFLRTGGGALDVNGTGAAKYYSDMAGAGAVFSDAFSAAAAPAAPVVASMGAPAPVPSVPSPAVPDAPAVNMPMGSGDRERPVVVRMEQPDAGQDVRDRSIAHIATGGYARP